MTVGNPPARSALVIGGGLAGIAAAAELAESGWNVTLLEARKTLGGRVFSYREPQSRRYLDNGQHVIVGACRNFIAFLERIGVRTDWYLQPRLNVPVYDSDGRGGRLYGVPAPAPLHLLPAFLTYPHLSLLDKARAVRGLVAAMLVDRRRDNLDDTTFYRWLRSHGQSERNIDNLWNVLIEGTLNDNVRDVSAAMGLMIVQEGLLRGRREANVGYPMSHLDAAIAAPASRYLHGLGVRVYCGCVANSIKTDRHGKVKHVEDGSGRILSADAYVSAIPFWTLSNILSDELSSLEPFSRLDQLQTSPIVNVHLRYDRQVMSGNFRYFLKSPLQWVFNRTHIQGVASDEGGGQSLTISISAAWEFINCSRGELTEKVLSEMTHAFPAAKHARLLEAVVVKQRNATFRCIPGAQRLRPGSRTASPNLFLAGEWTDTGWPSTMESAVISGYNAAAAVMSYPRDADGTPEQQSVRPVGRTTR